MNKLLPAAITTFFLALMALVFPVARAYATPSLTFDKSGFVVPQNATFTVNVQINVETNSAQSSKATIQYATNELDVVSVTSGGFFPEFAKANDTTNGILEITGYTTTPGAGFTANGILASVTFKSKKSSGTGSLVFSCTAGGHDSNILSVAGTNIIDCTKINTVALTYGASTITPTDTPAATPTPIPGNNTLPICSSLGADPSSGTGTPFTATFSCSGVDTDGYINAAYFDFGDGQTDTVEKNVGSPGTVTTTHTYMTVGSLGALCKVRDNNNVWTGVTDACRKIVSIQPKPIVRRVVVTRAPATNIITPTPTPQVGELVFVTPTATPSPELTPTPTETSKKGSSTFGWLLGISLLVIVVGAVIYLLSKRPPHIPPPPTMPPTMPPGPVQNPV